MKRSMIAAALVIGLVSETLGCGLITRSRCWAQTAYDPAVIETETTTASAQPAQASQPKACAPATGKPTLAPPQPKVQPNAQPKPYLSTAPAANIAAAPKGKSVKVTATAVIQSPAVKKPIVKKVAAPKKPLITLEQVSQQIAGLPNVLVTKKDLSESQKVLVTKKDLAASEGRLAAKVDAVKKEAIATHNAVNEVDRKLGEMKNEVHSIREMLAKERARLGREGRIVSIQNKKGVRYQITLLNGNQPHVHLDDGWKPLIEDDGFMTAESGGRTVLIAPKKSVEDALKTLQ